MIYLIKSAGYDENENLIHFLKIGYTEDSSKDKRFSQYKMHNPTCKILYEIPDLPEDIEKRIQYKFRDLLYSEYGREWFYYSDEIVNFFKDIDNIDLESLPKSPMSEKRDYKKFRRMVKEIVPWVTADIEDRDSYIQKIIDELGSNLNSTQDILDYIVKDYGEDSITKYLEATKRKETGVYSEDDIINRDVTRFLCIYETLTTIYDKLKMLYEYRVSQEVIQIVLDQIADSDEVKSYYLALGPQRLRALSYSVTKIKRELGIVTFSPELLINTITLNFNSGEKYSLANLKEKLGELYSSINYTATPKANDILNYFEVKEYMTTETIEGKKKRVRGYELLSRKEVKL
jgi:hypothetical protein